MNKIIRSGPVVNISEIDSDWFWSQTFPEFINIPIVSVQFNSVTDLDRCIVREGSMTGAIFFRLYS